MEVHFWFKLDAAIAMALSKAFAATVTTLAVYHYAPAAAQLVIKVLEALS
jgi:hypothetical protein